MRRDWLRWTGPAVVLRGQLRSELSEDRSWRYVSFAISNQFYMICSQFGIDYNALRKKKIQGYERNKNIPSISLYQEIDLIPQNIITKEPTAELKPDQMDKDTLPPYDILDKILYLLVEKESSVNEVVSAGYNEDIVIRVQNMLYNSEYKRRQGAPGVKISERNFGYDRRYPITNGFRDAKGD